MGPKIGILTVSDTRTLETDFSGPAAQNALTELGYDQFERRICPDRVETIQAHILALVGSCAAIFTTGGTGFSPRDVTPEATAQLLDRRADSLSELMRLKGLEQTSFSYLSRGVAGVRGRVLVVNLPGSPAGAADGIRAIGHLIGPILDALAD